MQPLSFESPASFQWQSCWALYPATSKLLLVILWSPRAEMLHPPHHPPHSSSLQLAIWMVWDDGITLLASLWRGTKVKHDSEHWMYWQLNVIASSDHYYRHQLAKVSDWYESLIEILISDSEDVKELGYVSITHSAVPCCSSAAEALLGLKKLLGWNLCNVSSFYFLFSFPAEMWFERILDSSNAITHRTVSSSPGGL